MNETYSIALRVRRTTYEDAYLAIPVTDTVMMRKADCGHNGLLAKVSDLGAQVRDLGDQHFVLLGQEGGGDQASQEGQAVHGAAEPGGWIEGLKPWALAA